MSKILFFVTPIIFLFLGVGFLMSSSLGKTDGTVPLVSMSTTSPTVKIDTPLFSGVSFAQKLKNNKNKAYSILDLKRAETLDEWISCAKEVAQKTNDPEAIEIVRFVEKNGMLGKFLPNKKGVTTFEKSEDDNWFFLVPLTEEDRVEQGGLISFLLANQNIAGQFIPGRILALKDFKAFTVSRFWKGFLFLHESKHAIDWVKTRHDMYDITIKCERERDARIFEQRLLTKTGGSGYIDFVDVCAKSIYAKTGLPDCTPLDTFFGPSCSETESAIRKSAVSIHANFRILETFKGDPMNNKAKFLTYMYKKTN